MLSLLLRLLSIFILILFVFDVSALQIGMSPTELKFKGAVNEKMCSSFRVLANEANFILNGEDRWALEDKRDLKIHNFSRSDVGIEVNYPKTISNPLLNEYNVCLKGTRGGSYHGILIYTLKGREEALGIWLNVDVSGQSWEEEIFDVENISLDVVLLCGQSLLLLVFLGLIMMSAGKENLPR